MFLGGQKRLSGLEGQGDPLFEAFVYSQASDDLVLARMQRFKRKSSGHDYLFLGVRVAKELFPVEPGSRDLKKTDIQLVFVRCYDAPEPESASAALRSRGTKLTLPKEAVFATEVLLLYW